MTITTHWYEFVVVARASGIVSLKSKMKHTNKPTNNFNYLGWLRQNGTWKFTMQTILNTEWFVWIKKDARFFGCCLNLWIVFPLRAHKTLEFLARNFIIMATIMKNPKNVRPHALSMHCALLLLSSSRFYWNFLNK